jgi:hypothetical protein
VTKLASTLALAILGLVVLAATSRALIALAEALVVPIAVCAVLVALLRCVWWLTGPR